MDLRGTATALRVLLWMGAAVAVVAVTSDLMELELLDDIMAGRPFTAAEVDANEARQGLIGVVRSVLFLVTAVVWLSWLGRANRNAALLATGRMQFTPGWSIAWYFVPVLNLWKPFQVLKEIWHVSQEGTRYHKPMGQVIVWWALCPTSIILWLAASWMKPGTMGAPRERYTATLVYLLADILHVGLCIAALLLVSSIQRMQLENLARLEAAANGPSAGS